MTIIFTTKSIIISYVLELGIASLMDVAVPYFWKCSFRQFILLGKSDDHLEKGYSWYKCINKKENNPSKKGDIWRTVEKRKYFLSILFRNNCVSYNVSCDFESVIFKHCVSKEINNYTIIFVNEYYVT